MYRIIPIVLVLMFSSFNAFPSDLRFLQYEGFQLIVDCDLNAAIRFSYTIGPDHGSLKRRSSFSKDPDLSSDCQQLSSSSYSHPGEAFDRGHLVPPNHLDQYKLGIYQSNYVTNILPRSRIMNRGAWLRTEEIVECYREEGLLRVYGGPIFKKENTRDFFVETHGVRTPSAFWKIVIKDKNDDHIAWIIPNTSEARRAKLKDYLVSINQIERALDLTFHFISDDEKDKVAPAIWDWSKDKEIYKYKDCDPS